MKLLVATKNEKKLKELETILSGLIAPKAGHSFELVSLRNFPDVPEVAEDGDTFEANAGKKALGYASATGLFTIAEDSGLTVRALRGEPGVYSARFSGAHKDDLENCKKVLRLMENIPEENRDAAFQCAVAFAAPDRLIHVEKGTVEGFVSRELRGSGGFGYDPLFYYPPYGKTLAQVSDRQKNKISHRGKALQKMAALLLDFLKDQSV